MSNSNGKIFASYLFKDDAQCNDKKNLGTVVNVVFDTKYFGASVLIFPSEKTKKLLRKILDSGKEITGDLIAELPLPCDEKTDELLKKIMEKGKDEAFDIAKEYLQDLEERLKKTYYLVSIADIAKAEKKSIILNEISELYEGECCNMETCKNDVALYGTNALPDVNSLLPITLNLVKIRGEIATDTDEKPGRIINLELDLKNGVVSNLIIQTIGQGARKLLVNPEDFDFDTFTTKSMFQEYSSIT